MPAPGQTSGKSWKVRKAAVVAYHGSMAVK